MNVALFGGSFDPVHRGHLAVARAAQRQFKLGKIYFVPANLQPLKHHRPATSFQHRYAMLVLATQKDKNFIPSLLEAPGEQPQGAPNYTIDTLQRFRAQLGARSSRLGRRRDRLFFLIGIDSFLDIARWHKAEELLREVEFIIASRPGFSLADVANALPPALRPKDDARRSLRRQAAPAGIVLGEVRLHLLPQVRQDVSATRIRQAASQGRSLRPWLDPAVAAYIAKTGLYRAAGSVAAGGRTS